MATVSSSSTECITVRIRVCECVCVGATGPLPCICFDLACSKEGRHDGALIKSNAIRLTDAG